MSARGRLPTWRQKANVAWRVPLRRAMKALAIVWRRRHPHTVFIGVTGSCGKTTTKDLIYEVLGSKFRGLRSPRSRNGYLTVFLHVLQTRRRHRFSVVEIASMGPGTIDRVLHLTQPDIGVVMNAGTDHYTAFRGADAVALEKGRLVEVLSAGGTAILNADDPRVLAMASRTRARVITFGFAPGAAIRAENLACSWPEGLRFTAVAGEERAEVHVDFASEVFAYNVLAALAVARVMGMTLADAAAGLRNVKPTAGRLQVIAMPDGVTFIGDYWKASLSSLPPAIDALRRAKADRRIAVIGTLSDYPGAGGQRYRRTAREFFEVADQVVFVGANAVFVEKAFKEFPEGALQAFVRTRDADEYLRRTTRPGDVVLLKGSGKVDHLERLFLNREKPIGCWRHSCGKTIHCQTCRLLYKPMPRAFEAKAL